MRMPCGREAVPALGVRAATDTSPVGLRGREAQVGFATGADARIEAPGRDTRLGLARTRRRALWRPGHEPRVVRLATALGGRGSSFQGRGCGLRDECDLIGLEDPRPALLGDRLGCPRVSLPDREADRRAQDEPAPLAGRDRLELEERLPDEALGLLVGPRLGEDETEHKQRLEPGGLVPARSPFERCPAGGLRLMPATELEEDVRRVAAEHRLVGGRHPASGSVSQARLDDRDRRLAARVHVEQQRPVRGRAHEVIESPGLAGHRRRVLEEGQALVEPPQVGSVHAERAGRMPADRERIAAGVGRPPVRRVPAGRSSVSATWVATRELPVKSPSSMRSCASVAWARARSRLGPGGRMASARSSEPIASVASPPADWMRLSSSCIAPRTSRSPAAREPRAWVPSRVARAAIARRMSATPRR